jgi:hypothetical protein
VFTEGDGPASLGGGTYQIVRHAAIGGPLHISEGPRREVQCPRISTVRINHCQTRAGTVQE